MVDTEEQQSREKHFERIYTLFEDQRTQFQGQVAGTVRTLAVAVTFGFSVFGVLLYFFLGDQATDLQEQNEIQISALEKRVDRFFDETRERIDESLSNERLSNRVKSAIVEESLKEARNAVTEAIQSPEVQNHKREFARELVAEISEGLAKQINAAVVLKVNTDVSDRIHALDPENRNLFDELVTSAVLEAVRADIDTYSGPRGDQGTIGARGKTGEQGPQGSRGLPGIDGRSGTDAAIQSGMVAAFFPGNLGDPVCPVGWQYFIEGSGRFILGANEKYPPGERAGEETVRLSVAQMPRHSHGVSRQTDVKADDDNAFLARGETSSMKDAATRATGDNQPHNNIPPYIALYFCKKD